MKRTQWFPADAKPARQGVYELLNKSTGAIFYARWIINEGHYYFYEGWSSGHMYLEDAAREAQFGLVQNRWQWRGLARAPKVDAALALRESGK